MNDIQISEQKLEDFIFQHLSGEDFYPGFSDIHENKDYKIPFCSRQMKLGAYGIADIITFGIDYDGSIQVNIYELKQGIIKANALVQVLRYKKGIMQIFEKLNIDYDYIECILIGSGVDDNEGLSVAISEMEGLLVYTYDICPKTGILLKYHDMIKSDTTIPTSTIKLLTCLDYASHDQFCGMQKGEF